MQATFLGRLNWLEYLRIMKYSQIWVISSRIRSSIDMRKIMRSLQQRLQLSLRSNCGSNRYTSTENSRKWLLAFLRSQILGFVIAVSILLNLFKACEGYKLVLFSWRGMNAPTTSLGLTSFISQENAEVEFKTYSLWSRSAQLWWGQCCVIATSIFLPLCARDVMAITLGSCRLCCILQVQSMVCYLYRKKTACQLINCCVLICRQAVYTSCFLNSSRQIRQRDRFRQGSSSIKIYLFPLAESMRFSRLQSYKLAIFFYPRKIYPRQSDSILLGNLITTGVCNRLFLRYLLVTNRRKSISEMELISTKGLLEVKYCKLMTLHKLSSYLGGSCCLSSIFFCSIIRLRQLLNKLSELYIFVFYRQQKK